jgi:hypothetical protein
MRLPNIAKSPPIHLGFQRAQAASGKEKTCATGRLI